MAHVVLAVSSLLTVLLVLALAREVRLRRALQKMLSRIFHKLRNPHAQEPAPPADELDSAADVIDARSDSGV